MPFWGKQSSQTEPWHAAGLCKANSVKKPIRNQQDSQSVSYSQLLNHLNQSHHLGQTQTAEFEGQSDQPIIQSESTHEGVNWRSMAVTQTQQQRSESPTVTLTWHVSKCKEHKLHQRIYYYIFGGVYVHYIYLHAR